MSTRRLSRYPLGALKDELPAQIIHELAHLAGYEEWAAKRIQNYVRRIMSEPCRLYVGGHIRIDETTREWFSLTMTYRDFRDGIRKTSFQPPRVEYDTGVRKTENDVLHYASVTAMNIVAPWHKSEFHKDYSAFAIPYLDSKGNLHSVDAHWGKIEFRRKFESSWAPDKQTVQITVDGKPVENAFADWTCNSIRRD